MRSTVAESEPVVEPLRAGVRLEHLKLEHHLRPDVLHRSADELLAQPLVARLRADIEDVDEPDTRTALRQRNHAVVVCEQDMTLGSELV